MDKQDISGMRRPVSAQITIMAALSMTLVLSLILTCYKSVTDITYYTQIKQACMLSMESAFSAYHDDMLEEYNLLLLERKDSMEKRIEQYIEANIESYCNDIELMSVRIDDEDYVTDGSGDNIRKEIAAYMEYGVYSEVIDSLKQSEEQVRKAEKINEVTGDIAAFEEDLCNMDSKVLELLELVEGIDTTEDGLVISSGNPQAANAAFAKNAVNGEVSMDSVHVANEKVFNAVYGAVTGYVNVRQVLSDMVDDADGLYAIGDEASDESGNNSYAQVYRRNYEMLESAVKGMADSTGKALDVIAQFETAQTGAADRIRECIDKVEAARELLGEDLYTGLSEDLSDMRDESSSSDRAMCDVNTIKSALERNKVILDGVVGLLEGLDVELLQSNCIQTRQRLVKFENSLVGLSCDGLEFDYSNIDFSSGGGGLSAIKKLKSTITDGIEGLVLDTDVSDKTISYGDLATSLENGADSGDSDDSQAKEALLMNEYLMTKFNSYTDYLENEADENALLDYTLEYILCGGQGDKENLGQTMLELSAVRTGLNLAYLITDRTKKAEAYTMASAALGFTGNMAVIKAGQYLILTVWAYGEAVADLRQLYRGGKVDLVKTSGTWKLSLENLLTLNFSDDDGKSDTGLDYEMYLRMLLLVEGRVHKNFRTMAAMELRMISLGYTDFRMKNYLVSAGGSAVFKCKNRADWYMQDMGCSYI